MALALAFGATLLTANADAQTQTSFDVLPTVIRAVIPAEASQVSASLLMSSPKMKLYVVSFNVPSKDTEVIVVRLTGGAKKIVKRFRIEYGYSPTVIVNKDFRYRGNPVALVQVQFGAAAAGIEVLGVNGSSVLRLGVLRADYFDFVTLGDNLFLVAHDDVNLFDVPILYCWTGTSFANGSTHHPEFYKPLADRFRKASAENKLAPPVQLRFERLLRLADEPALR